MEHQRWSIYRYTCVALFPGCYNLRAQYVLASACVTTPAGATGTGACGVSNTVNTVNFPQAPIITPPANTCNTAFALPTVPAVPGFTVQYSIDGSIYAAAPVVPQYIRVLHSNSTLCIDS